MSEMVYSDAYNAMIQEMGKGTYTEVTAKKVISNLYIKKMIPEDEFNLLMEEAGKLSANTDYGEINNQIVELKESISKIETRLDTLESAIKEGGTVVPEPEPSEEPTGGEFDPIEAYRGITYYKDKYYKDPEDTQIYKCYRDNDSEPGTGVRLDYLPHELVNIYFYFARVS